MVKKPVHLLNSMTTRLSLKKTVVRVVCTRVLNPINRTSLEYRLFEQLIIEMGELSGIEPPRMNWLAADLPTEFDSFRQYGELIFRGPFTDKDESARVTYILLWVCQEGFSHVKHLGPIRLRQQGDGRAGLKPSSNRRPTSG